MAYTKSPYVPTARRIACNLVRWYGLTPAQAARRTGVHRSTIGRWLKRSEILSRSAPIETRSSVPHHHPNQLPSEVISQIVQLRKQRGRCAAVIHAQLDQTGVQVSLSSVRRTLQRQGLVAARSKWARKRTFTPRPGALAPGDLVQLDTIHFNYPDGSKYYVYTILDVYSRLAWARHSHKCNQAMSYQFVLQAQAKLQIPFHTIQTDNGSEFGRWFADMLMTKQIDWRHTRVRTPNDNAHLERFNRTVQDECLGRHPKPEDINYLLEDWLEYYNTERLHLGISLKTPTQMLPRC